MVPLSRRPYIRLVKAVLGCIGDSPDRVTLKGFTGSFARGARLSGFSAGGALLPASWNANAPGAPGLAGGTLSTCSNVDQIHCGRLGVFWVMCRPTRPIDTSEHLP